MIAQPGVPVGGYTLQVLKNMGLTTRVTAERRQPGDRRPRACSPKVALGQADAGFVYSTDAKTVPGG